MLEGERREAKREPFDRLARRSEAREEMQAMRGGRGSWEKVLVEVEVWGWLLPDGEGGRTSQGKFLRGCG